MALIKFDSRSVFIGVVSIQHLESFTKVEVFLAYETLLSDPLQLPLSTRHMLFEGIAGVSETDLQLASAEANLAVQEPGALENFLESWEPWQRYQRTQIAQWLTWDQLGESFQEPDLESWCTFTLEPFHHLKQPVVIDKGSADEAGMDAEGAPAENQKFVAMEFADLLEWWVANGNDPITKRPIELHHIKRVELDRKMSAKEVTIEWTPMEIEPSDASNEGLNNNVNVALGRESGSGESGSELSSSESEPDVMRIISHLSRTKSKQD